MTCDLDKMSVHTNTRDRFLAQICQPVTLQRQHDLQDASLRSRATMQIHMKPGEKRSTHTFLNEIAGCCNSSSSNDLCRSWSFKATTTTLRPCLASFLVRARPMPAASSRLTTGQPNKLAAVVRAVTVVLTAAGTGHESPLRTVSLLEVPSRQRTQER